MMAEIVNYIEWVLTRLSALFVVARQVLLLAINWKYISHIVIALAVTGAAIVFYRSYRRWRRAWLSDLVDRTLSDIRRNSVAAKRQQRPRISASGMWRTCRNYAFRFVHAMSAYTFKSFWRSLTAIYLPSVASVLAVLILLALATFTPHWPTHADELLHPLNWWKALSSNLDDQDSMPRIFEGLIVVIVALIVFVAESVRGSKNSDEKKVLLQISSLWPLALLITLAPLTFLYPPATGLTALVAIAVTFIAVRAFALVLQNLLDAGASVRAQRNFLKQRVRGMVLSSAQERVGNKLLFERLGVGKEIAINFTMARSWLPNGEKNYAFIPAPGHGTLADINLHELKSLALLLEQRARAKIPAPAATAQIDITAGPTPRATTVTDDKLSRAYLLRRFKEELPQESVFSRNTSVLAVPKDLARDRALMEEVRARATHIFKFSTEEQPSDAFRREMESTKDRLIGAIRSVSLGAVEDLKQTYLLVAEEFLTILTELGGGYTAEQAREERSNIFTGWSEIRWLVRDVRELLIAASQTDNTDVIGNIAFLPYAIAIRALQAGDQLLFQEFLNFGTFIYFLGSEKPAGSPVRGFMTDRSWRYLREIADYYVQPSLMDEGDND